MYHCQTFVLIRPLHRSSSLYVLYVIHTSSDPTLCVPILALLHREVRQKGRAANGGNADGGGKKSSSGWFSWCSIL